MLKKKDPNAVCSILLPWQALPHETPSAPAEATLRTNPQKPDHLAVRPAVVADEY